MKSILQNFFKSKKNKIICFSILILTILASAGFYLNTQAQEQKKIDQARIEKEKAEEEARKEQEEKEKIELAKAEEKKKAEELEKEKLKAEEEKAKVEQQKAEVDKREKDNFKENKTNSVKKETQKNNSSTSKKTENTKKNKKKDNNNNNNNNNNGNKFEVEEDENTYSKIGNTGKFFSTRAEATSWVKSQVANENSLYWKNGYKSWWVGQCKHNGKIGWTVSFIK